MRFSVLVALCAAAVLGVAAPGVGAEQFIDHGVVAPIGQTNWSGPVAAEDADGTPLIVTKLWARVNDSASTYLFINAKTGEWEQLNPGVSAEGAFTTYLSRANMFYDTLANQFIEVDVASREIRRVGEIPGGMALSMTEDDRGVIYAALHPSATLVAYNPETREFKDHGQMAEEPWAQYPNVAVDDAGWAYVVIGQRRGNLIAYHPETGNRRQLIDEETRDAIRGTGTAWRGDDGKAYARLPGQSEWYKLHEGEVQARVDEPSASQAVFRNMPRPRGRFPDGTVLERFDVQNKEATIRDPGADESRQITFDYKSDGRRVYAVVTGPDGKIYGSTGRPLRIFRYCPETGEMDNWGLGGHGGHTNVMTTMDGIIYGAVYANGSLIACDPSKPFDDARISESANPREVAGGSRRTRDIFGRPRTILAHPDGRHVIMGGNATRVLAGGGMLIYDTQTGESEIFTHEQLLPKQGVSAIAADARGNLVIGGTAWPATAGVAEATNLELGVFDWERREMVFRKAPFTGASSIRHMKTGPGGIVYGIADNKEFFVFDAETGWVLHNEKLDGYGPFLDNYLGHDVMEFGPDGNIYIVFQESVVKVDGNSLEHSLVAKPPVPITVGLTIHGGRLYFGSQMRLWSVDLGIE